MVNKALNFFTGANGQRRTNCSLAIAQAFKDIINLPEELILNLSSTGSGKAPDGFCGALYAVLAILKQIGYTNTDDVKKSFNEHCGSLYCVEIRKLKAVSCSGCVKKAAQILDDTLTILPTNLHSCI